LIHAGHISLVKAAMSTLGARATSVLAASASTSAAASFLVPRANWPRAKGNQNQRAAPPKKRAGARWQCPWWCKGPLKKKTHTHTHTPTHTHTHTKSVGRLSLCVELRFFCLFCKNLLHVILTPPGRYYHPHDTSNPPVGRWGNCEPKW
jgi:hypothetical protein